MKKIIFTVLISLFAYNGYSQTRLGSEDAFIYFMKANGYKKGDNINNNSIAYGRFKWFDVYIQTYMKYQYSQSINDEFKYLFFNISVVLYIG